MAKFKPEVLEVIKSDPDLFGAVAKEMGVKPISLGKIIERNGNSLNQYNVIKLVASHLNKNMDDVLDEVLPVKESQS